MNKIPLQKKLSGKVSVSFLVLLVFGIIVLTGLLLAWQEALPSAFDEAITNGNNND